MLAFFRLAAPRVLALGLLTLAVAPALKRWNDASDLVRRLDEVRGGSGPSTEAAWAVVSARDGDGLDPLLLARTQEIGPLLSSWQSVGGCGAGSATGAGAGVKWIGRGVRGGAFNTITQASYTRIYTEGKLEHHTFFSTLVTRDLGDKWLIGANVPFVFKYLNDPYDLGVDISNGGLGDVSLQVTRKLGKINATSLTAQVGLPTGTYDAKYKMRLLHPYQQTGFGRYTGALILDHVMDQVWGLVVVGATASYRGGQNAIDNYRAPSATGYMYTGYFLGPFVPVIGLAVTGFKGHDRDLTLEMRTGLFTVAANASLEWSNDYVALLVGASLPYQYDGFRTGTNGTPKSPWGFGSWMVAAGIAISPF